jgi:hypothetical protein
MNDQQRQLIALIVTSGLLGALLALTVLYALVRYYQL